MIDEHPVGPAGEELIIAEDPIVKGCSPGFPGLDIELPDAEFSCLQNELQAIFAGAEKIFPRASTGFLCHLLITFSVAGAGKNIILINYRFSTAAKRFTSAGSRISGMPGFFSFPFLLRVW